MTPPSVQGCPASFTDRTESLQKKVTWAEPTFTDNVGVVSVLSNRQPGFQMNTSTSIRIRYAATDAAGNEAYCTFNITLEGMWYFKAIHIKAVFCTMRKCLGFFPSVQLSLNPFIHLSFGIFTSFHIPLVRFCVSVMANG